MNESWRNVTDLPREARDPLLDALRARLGTRDLGEWLDSEGERLAALGVQTSGRIELTSQLLGSRGINAARGARAGMIGPSAQLLPKGGSYEIVYRAALPPAVRRFAIAHEIGHTYWLAPGGGARPLSPYQLSPGPDVTIEGLCNRFAGALLLPRGSLSAWLRSMRWSENSMRLDVIPTAARIFDVPEQAAAKRIFFERQRLEIAIVCLRLIPSGGASVLWAVLPPSLSRTGNLRSFSIPLRAYGRRIPPNMIPDVGDGTPWSGLLDSRWRDGLRPQPRVVARVPLKRRVSSEGTPGHVVVTCGRVYLAILP